MVLSALPAPSLFLLHQSIVLYSGVFSFSQTLIAPCRNRLRQAYNLGLLSCKERLRGVLGLEWNSFFFLVNRQSQTKVYYTVKQVARKL